MWRSVFVCPNGSVLNAMLLHRGKHTRIKPAAIRGYKSVVEWMPPHIGKTPLANIKNAAAKELVMTMKQAELPHRLHPRLDPFFEIVMEGLRGLVDGTLFRHLRRRRNL